VEATPIVAPALVSEQQFAREYDSKKAADYRGSGEVATAPLQILP